MVNSPPERMVLGFLENLSYYEGAIRIAEEKGLESRLVRQSMTDTIREVFEGAGISYIGPVGSMHYPVGGFFFMMGSPEERDLKGYVLESLGVDKDLIIHSIGYGYDIPLGLIIGVYSDKHFDSIDWCEDEVLDFATHVAAFNRNRRERDLEEYYKPYLVIIDEDFPKRFPIDEYLDST